MPNTVSAITRFRNRIARVWVILLLLVPSSCQREANTERETVHVFAAVSLREGLEEIGRQFEAETGFDVSFNFAGSNVLAQQIQASSRADLFISADSDWMDYLQERGKLGENTRIDLLQNTLVAVCAKNARWMIENAEAFCQLDFAFLCIGEPEAVPAGRYARDWLARIPCSGTTAWELVRERVSPAPDVRAALAQVGSRADALGIVYLTDYLIYQDQLRLLFEGPSETVSYPAAMTEKGMGKLAAGRFFTFLQSDESKAVFENFGFRADLQKED